MSDGILQIEYVEANASDWGLIEGSIIQESALTLYINGREWVTLMCTPVDREELILGFLLREGSLPAWWILLCPYLPPGRGCRHSSDPLSGRIAVSRAATSTTYQIKLDSDWL